MGKLEDFKFADIISLVGIILLGIGVFLGLNYIFLGSLVTSIPITIFSMGVALGLVFLLTKIKAVEINQKKYQLVEIIILIAGYGVFCIITFFFFTHFLNVELQRKNAITDIAVKELNEGSQLFDNFEAYVDKKCNTYSIELDNAIKNKSDLQTYLKFGFKLDGGKDEDQKRIMVDVLHKKMQSPVYDLLKSNANSIITSELNSVNAWNWIKIPKILRNICLQREEWKNQIITFSQATQQGKNDPFSFEFKNNEDLTSMLREFQLGGQSMFLGLIILLIIHFMILWPYIFGYRAANLNVDGKDGQQVGITWPEESILQEMTEKFRKEKQEKKVKDIEEDKFWNQSKHTKESCEQYIHKYPNGKYFSQAQIYIEENQQKNIEKKLLLLDIKLNPENYPAQKIKDLINSRKISKLDLIESQIITEAALELFLNPPTFFQNQSDWKDLPRIPQGNTDVYFLGIPGSGKSCVLAGLLHQADNRGIKDPDIKSPHGFRYLNELQHCIEIGYVPVSTDTEKVNYLSLDLLGKNRRRHPVSIIEMSGEYFNRTFESVISPGTNSRSIGAIDYLQNTNRKAIFFVIDYSLQRNSTASVMLIMN